VKVVIAPDSFKGSVSNVEAAFAIRSGWLSQRPGDVIICKPMADGGEGTLETIAAANDDSIKVEIDLPHRPYWLLLPDGTACVELAMICGITVIEKLDALHASTYSLGRVLKVIANDQRVMKIIVAVGGSASTDGGVGAVAALGGRFLNQLGDEIALGGDGLNELASIDLSQVTRPPSGGVVCLADVTNPLLGESGAASVFAPQKGATVEEVAILEAGLTQLQHIAKLPDFPGAGAAGGTPYGLRLAWDAQLESGSKTIANIIQLEEAIRDCDLVITGEGKLDSQSEHGKVVGTVVALAKKYEKPIRYCVGSSTVPFNSQPYEDGIALMEIAPSLGDAMGRSQYWLTQAGVKLAADWAN